MSNDVAVVNGHIIPEYLRNRETPVTSDLGRAGGPPRIAIMKDGFKIMQDGRDVKLPSPLPVIILAASPTGNDYNRAYYSAPYQPGSMEPPDCSSSDGIVPDGGELKQAPTCAQCQWSQWGSAPGGKGQACAQGKTLFVVPANMPKSPVFQLRVPPTSLKPVAAYGAEITSYGVPLAAVITNLGIELEGDTQYQKLTLNMGGFLQEQTGAEALARSESAEIKALVTVVDPTKQIAVAQSQQPAPQQPAPQTQPAPPQQPAPQPPQQSTEWGGAPAPDQSAPQWGGAPAPQQPPAQQAPPQQPAPQAPPQGTGVTPGTAEVDSAGEIWDPEKHSSGKTKLKNGTWKKKKGYQPPAGTQQLSDPSPSDLQPAGSPPPANTQQPTPQQDGGLDDILAQWG